MVDRTGSVSIAPTAARPRLLFAAVAVVLTMLVCVFALEVGLRIAKRHVPFQPDPQYIRSLRPGVREPHVTYDSDDLLNGRSSNFPSTPVSLGEAATNREGLRMPDDVGPKQPDERRVLLFGDSFVEGLGVRSEDRFAEILDRRLRALGTRHRWRVINGGIQNGSPAQYLMQARRFLPEFKPDIVVMFLAPNDMNDDFRFERDVGFVYDAGGYPVRPRAAWRLWWLQKSYVLRYASVAAIRRDFLKSLVPAASPEITPPDFYPLLCSGDRAQEALFRRKTGRYVERLKELSEAAGARFLVHLTQYRVTAASEPSVLPRHEEEHGKRAAFRCDENGGRDYDAFIEGFLRERHIDFANPHQAFLQARSRSPKQHLWLVWDYHYSPAGHRIVADDLLRSLQPLLD